MVSRNVQVGACWCDTRDDSLHNSCGAHWLRIEGRTFRESLAYLLRSFELFVKQTGHIFGGPATVAELLSRPNLTRNENAKNVILKQFEATPEQGFSHMLPIGDAGCIACGKLKATSGGTPAATTVIALCGLTLHANSARYRVHQRPELKEHKRKF